MKPSVWCSLSTLYAVIRVFTLLPSWIIKICSLHLLRPHAISSFMCTMLSATLIQMILAFPLTYFNQSNVSLWFPFCSTLLLFLYSPHMLKSDSFKIESSKLFFCPYIPQEIHRVLAVKVNLTMAHSLCAIPYFIFCTYIFLPTVSSTYYNIATVFSFSSCCPGHTHIVTIIILVAFVW